MAIQTIPGGLIIPPFPSDPSSAPNFGTISIDAVDEKVAVVFQVPKTGNIRKIAFRAGSISAGTWIFDARLETVSLTALEPTGTLFDTNTNISLSVEGTEDNTWITSDAFTADAAVVGGDYAAMVLNLTTDPGGAFGFTRFTDVSNNKIRQNRSVLDTGAGYGASSDRQWLFAAEYDDGSYAPLFDVYPFTTLTTTSTGNAASVRRFAMKFKIPFPAQISGAWFWIDADGDFDLILYDSDGTTELATLSVDKDQRAGTIAAPSLYQFDTLVSLTKDTFYRIAVVPTSATTCDVYDMELDSVALMDALFGGQNFHLSTHNGTSWTDTTTKRPWAGIQLNGFDDGVGGGGGNINPLQGPLG